MRPRWLRSVGITIGALALCSLFYGHHYSSLISAGSRTPREGVGYDLPSKSLEWIPAVSHGRERNREKTETLRVQRPSKEQVPDTCPTSLQLRVKNDSYFNTLFNFEVPLLLWNSHMTERNWDILGKRPVPYGWKDLPHEDVASTLKLLNDSAHRVMFRRQGPQKCIHCAVVGNGGILNGSRKGKEIDGHDYVFRLNGAVIKGFEKDVGTKTSFYGFTVNTMKNSLISYNEYGFTQTPKGADLRYIFIPSDLRDYVMLRSGILGVQVPSGYDKGDKPSVYFGPKPSPRKFKMLHPDFLLYTRERFLKSDILNTKYAGLYMPSTGGLMLLTALHSCDQVSAYGFITPDYNRYSDHYYELQKMPLEFYANHDMILEMQLWGRLHDKGIIKLYKR